MYNLADWSKAPEWAKWFAVDGEGSAWWYSEKPRQGAYTWGYSGWIGGIQLVGYIDDMANIDWTQTLEARP